MIFKHCIWSCMCKSWRSIYHKVNTYIYDKVYPFRVLFIINVKLAFIWWDLPFCIHQTNTVACNSNKIHTCCPKCIIRNMFCHFVSIYAHSCHYMYLFHTNISISISCKYFIKWKAHTCDMTAFAFRPWYE